MSRSYRRPSTDVNPYKAACGHPGPAGGQLMTRRSALKAMLGISVVTAGLFASRTSAYAAEASKETTDALNAAQSAYDEATAKLEAIAKEYDELNQQLNDAVAQIDAVQEEIDATQTQIDDKQAEIDDKQDEIDTKQSQLGNRISDSYKSGTSNLLSLILNSSSFEELASNLTYMGKINESDEELIDEVKQAKAELERAKDELEATKQTLEQQKSEYETLKADLLDKANATQAKQQEASDLVASLSDDVRELIEKRDAEILAAAEEERRQREAAEAARKAAEEAAKKQNSSGGNGGASNVTGDLSNATASQKGAAIVSATNRVGSPGLGYCAMWVSQVYQAAGLGYPGGNANNMYYNFCSSSNKSTLEPGMIIAVPSHPHTVAGRIYGHVGIYIGNGMVKHNIGPITTQSLDSWISFYGTTYTPRWGWAG